MFQTLFVCLPNKINLDSNAAPASNHSAVFNTTIKSQSDWVRGLITLLNESQHPLQTVPEGGEVRLRWANLIVFARLP